MIFISPLISNLIGNMIFFKSNLWAFTTSNFLTAISMLILYLEGLNSFKIAFAMSIGVLGYVSSLKFFFEFIYVYIYNLKADIMKIMFPFIVIFFQYAYLNILLNLPVYQRFTSTMKLIVSVTFGVIFEFIKIGNLHNLKSNGDDFKIFLNLAIYMTFDIDKQFTLSKIILIKIMNYLNSENNIIHMNDYEIVHLEAGKEYELFSIFYYFFLFYLNILIFQKIY